MRHSHAPREPLGSAAAPLGIREVFLAPWLSTEVWEKRKKAETLALVFTKDLAKASDAPGLWGACIVPRENLATLKIMESYTWLVSLPEIQLALADPAHGGIKVAWRLGGSLQVLGRNPKGCVLPDA